jgi:starvation-inducible DNA-binding protein
MNCEAISKKGAYMSSIPSAYKPVSEENPMTPTDISIEGAEKISASLRLLLADVFTLFLKTKNFHWHVSGSHFREYHLLLDDQSAELFAITDDVAERARKIGGTTLRSIGDISRSQRLKDNDQSDVDPFSMLTELCHDNKTLTRLMRETHKICERFNDLASASLIENWIDQSERRTWFLLESIREK